MDYTNYGEFLFITFYLGQDVYCAYGLGLHEYRQKIINGFNVFQDNDFYKKEKNIPLSVVETEIIQREIDIKRLQENPDSYSDAFDQYADMCDDDAAYSDLFV